MINYDLKFVQAETQNVILQKNMEDMEADRKGLEQHISHQDAQIVGLKGNHIS